MAPPLKPLASAAQRPVDPRVRIGHGHLKVSDLDRALAFYCGVLGFELMQRIGDEAAFLAGYLAAGMTETGTIGTFGGINIPTVLPMEANFAD